MAHFYATDPYEPRIHDVKVPFRKVLARLPDDFHICLEFRIDKDYDVLIVHPRGIHAIEVKHETNPVTGGPTDTKWSIKYRGGTESERPNFYGQATDAANALKEYLRQCSRDILSSPCSPSPCRQELCKTHRDFWSRCRVFPYVAIPDWNPKNNIQRTTWCWLIQGSHSVSDPAYVIDAVTRRDWDLYPETKGLRLTDSEIARLIAKLPVMPVKREVALGELPLWAPGIDSRVERSLRESELTELRDHLGKDPLVAIVGDPKVGKTSAAKLLAMDLDATGVPILDYDFRLHDPKYGSLSEVMLERFLDQLKLPAQRSIQDNIAAFVGALTNRRICVILDNLESILDQQSLISDVGLSRLIDTLLGSRSRMQSFVIVTTTRSFSTQLQNTFPEYRLLGIGRDLAVRHLTTNENYRWSADHAERIYGIRQGHPHVMHTASIQIKQAMELGLSFDEAFQRLSPEVVNFLFLYSKFTPPEQAVIEAVALHPNGMRVDATEWVVARRAIPDSILPVITRLYEKGALSRVGSGWIKLLPQDQPYVYGRIGTVEKMHRSALEWYKRLARGLLVEKAREEDLDTAYDLLFYHSVRAREPNEAWEALFSSPLSNRLDMLGKHHTLAYMCRQLLECEGFEKLSPSKKGRLLFTFGLALRHLGDIDEAENCLAKAEKLFSDADDAVGQAEALIALGLVSFLKGKYGRSELDYYDLAEELLVGRQDIEAKGVHSILLGRKGMALQRAGAALDEVFQCHNASLQIARDLGDKGLLTSQLVRLGVAHRELGTRNIPAAIRCFQEAVKISEELQSRSDLVQALRGLAMTYEKSNDLPRALDLYQRVLDKTSKDDVYGMLDRLGTLAHVHKSLGKYTESEQLYNQALELARRIQNQKGEAENLDELGNLYRTLAHNKEKDPNAKAMLLKKAIECIEPALRIQESLQGDPAGLANRHQELARTLFALGRIREAQRHFRDAVRYARDAKRQHLEAWQFKRLGDTFEEQGRKAETILCYKRALELDPRRMHDLKGTIANALRALDSDDRQAVEMRLKSLDNEIEKLLVD